MLYRARPAFERRRRGEWSVLALSDGASVAMDAQRRAGSRRAQVQQTRLASNASGLASYMGEIV